MVNADLQYVKNNLLDFYLLSIGITIPIEEFKEFIQQSIEHSIQKCLSNLPNKSDEDLLTREEVMEILKISSQSLNEYTKSGILKGLRLAGNVRYFRKDVMSSLQEIRSIKYTRRNNNVAA